MVCSGKQMQFDYTEWWDITKEVGKDTMQEAFRDFEGLAPATAVLQNVKEAINTVTDESNPVRQVLGDIVCNLMYEAADEATYPTLEDCINCAHHVLEVLSTRYWLKSGYVW